MSILFVDLKAQYQSIKQQIDSAIASVIKDTAFIGGKYVSDFETAFAGQYGVKHCIGVGNGTDAIYISLKALGIGYGDEVITVANSWISTAETITQTGARPIFVDIDPDHYTIDTDKIIEKITPRTKAIIPVHLYGQPARIDHIREICDKYQLFLLEDCAQAHFAKYNGRLVGTFGNVGTFSFYPGKNLGAYGDAGAIITNDDAIAEKCRMIANHGALNKHQHQIEGVNSRMDGIQAAILSAKLPHIFQWNRMRYEIAMKYNRLFKEVPEITPPVIRRENEHVFHLYVIRIANRDELQTYLGQNGVATSIHYPKALPFLQAYAYLGHKLEDFPISASYQDQILSLPMYPELSDEMIEYVSQKIRAFFRK